MLGGLATRNAKITLASIFQVGLVGLHEMMHEASGVGIEKYMDREFGLELI